MKDMFRMFAFVGVLSLGCSVFAEEDNTASQEPVKVVEQKTEATEAIQVVCPENCENCDAEQPAVENAENK